MNDCTIWSSAIPTACILAIFSLAGLEKLHSSMLQVATESLQPHWHCSRWPTRRTSTLGFSDAVCASATTATRIARKLILNRRMFLGDPYDFRARVLSFNLARRETDEGAPDEDEAADPDPAHERENVGLNDGALIV